MTPMISWVAAIWGKFSLWASTQPTFVEVAIGMGLFYVVLLASRATYRLTAFLFSGLFSSSHRPQPTRKPPAPRARSKTHLTVDDDIPPFVFR